MDFEKSCLNILCIDMKDIYAEFFYIFLYLATLKIFNYYLTPKRF